MRRTRKARVVGPDNRLDPVERPVAHLVAFYVVACHLKDGPVHGQIVMTGGNNEVDPLDDPVAVHAVVVEQSAPGRLRHPYAFLAVYGRPRSHVGAEDTWVGEEFLQHVDAVKDLDQPGPVVLERTARVRPQASPVLGKLGVGGGRPQLVDHVEPRQGPTLYSPSG